MNKFTYDVPIDGADVLGSNWLAIFKADGVIKNDTASC